jgi:DNA-binding winged helix-turn-helix (wHTH) protein/TolB-like protein
VTRYLFDQFSFDPADGRLERIDSGATVTLRPQVASLLHALLEAPRTVIDRESLCRAVWGEGAVVDFDAGLAAIVRELRQALDQLGGRASLLETMPRRGFRFGADVRCESGSVPEGDTEPRHAGVQEPARYSRRWLLLAALASAMLLAWLIARWANPPEAPPAPDGHGELTLAVLPFERLDDAPADGARLELLLADAMLVQLWQAELEDVGLIGRATLLPYGRREDVAAAVARDLGVRLLIEGSIVRDGAEWQVTARLLDMPHGRVAWSETVSWRDVDALPVRDTAARLVESLGRAWAESPQLSESLRNTH